MKPLIWVLALVMLLSQWTFADNKIVFNLSPTGYPPYMFKDAKGQAQGVVYDVLYRVATKYGYEVVVVGVPKKRVVLQLRSGELDATAVAKEWVKNPEDFEFSDVIVQARDVLFSLKEKPIKFNSIEDLYDKNIGIHLGYSYPLLKEAFNKNLIVTSVVNTETAMLGKVFMERSDAAVVNELVGQWLIKNTPHWRNRFVISKREIGGFDYRIQFSKKWKDFVLKVNRELAGMKRTGTLDTIKSKYKL
ncbi:MAG: transporter substrate-binding domain-containing protein [Bermanella sp.]